MHLNINCNGNVHINFASTNIGVPETLILIFFSFFQSIHVTNLTKEVVQTLAKSREKSHCANVLPTGNFCLIKRIAYKVRILNSRLFVRVGSDSFHLVITKRYL